MVNKNHYRFLLIYFYLKVSIYYLLFGIYPVMLNAQSAGYWWLQSSLSDSVNHIQFHGSASYNYTRMQGIISGTMNTSNLTFIVRRGVFTNFSRLGNDKMDLNLKSSVNLKYKTKSAYFTDYIDVDLSKFTFVEGGYIWERDDALLLRNRNTFYGGMGLNLTFLKKVTLKSLFATGGIYQEFTVPVEKFDISEKPYAAFYSVHDVGFKISPETLISGKMYYFTDLNDLEKIRYGCIVKFSVGLLKHVKLIAGYQYKYDRELKLLDLLPDNSTQNIGIEVSL
jgi:hypothetical protein